MAKKLKHLNFEFTYPKNLEETKLENSVSKQARARGPLEPRYDGKKSISRVRVILQGFAMWAKNHISDCKPHQPEKQMARASKEWVNT